MALQKQENWSMGGAQPTVNYHRIDEICPFDPQMDLIKIRVSSWYDSAARSAGDKPYMKRDYTFSLTTHTGLADALRNDGANDLLTELYTALKAETEQHSGFFSSGTTDV